MGNAVMTRSLFILALGFLGVSCFDVQYSWRQVEFDFPDQKTKEEWKHTGRLQPNNTLLLDVDRTGKDPKDRVFATTPSFGPGVPATLSTVITNDNGRVFLRPFPSWEENNRDDCSGLTSVMRVKTTKCAHLWVLDSGRMDIMGEFTQKCPPKLRVYDLKSDKIFWEYQIPEETLVDDSLLGTVEVVGNCTHPFAYLADIVGHGIIVVDTVKKQSWRVQNELTGNDDDATNFNLNGQSFTLPDGVISLTAARNTLYFHSLASYREHLVQTTVLNNPHYFVGSDEGYQYFHTSTGKRSGQSGPAVIARDSVMFFSNLPENALYCWRVGTPYVPENQHLVFRDDVKFQFPSGLKIVTDRYGKDWLMATTSRFQNYMKKVVNPKEVNYRILTVDVDSLLSKC
ncbi:Protein yellow [Blattella germanica]|nr:Protein yellow [Blattella germanica]